MKQTLYMIMISALLLAGCAKQADAPAAQASSAPETAEPSASAAASEPSAQPNGEGITEEEAKAIAFEQAGVKETDVTFIQVRKDIEHGTEVYDVEFLAGEKEYDYEIAISNGEIISFDTDMEADAPAAASSGASISEEDAKKAALDHAGLKESDVTYREVKRETEDGAEVYKIEFVSGQTEYEYEIRVSDGVITEFDSEPVKD